MKTLEESFKELNESTKVLEEDIKNRIKEKWMNNAEEYILKMENAEKMRKEKATAEIIKEFEGVNMEIAHLIAYKQEVPEKLINKRRILMQQIY